MSSFQLQADMYNSITPSETEARELKERVTELENKIKITEQDELAKKFYEELHKEFMENSMKGIDVPTSMLKGVATVLATVVRELWRP